MIDDPRLGATEVLRSRSRPGTITAEGDDRLDRSNGLRDGASIRLALCRHATFGERE